MSKNEATESQRQSEAIRGNQLLVIQRSSESIRCNQAAPQTQSGAISMPGALCFRVFVFWAGRKACVLCFCVLGWHNGPVFCVFVFWQTPLKTQGGGKRHVREALQRWATELEDPDHPGVPMACREWVPLYGAPGVGVIYADASGEEGWAAWTFESGIVYMVSGVWGPLDVAS
jgi:hypothetical protein